jgi:hypothetical protein
MTVPEWRNPVYNQFGTIDCEINHPEFGWIPTTANPDDVEPSGQELYAAIIASGVPIAPYVAPPPQPYSLPVSAFWGRMTDLEAEDFDAAMSTASPLRLRRQFNSATSMASDGELFAFVRGVLVTVVTSARADELMANGNFTEAMAPAVI